MSFTYTTLTASIQEWTQNDESTFVAEIPFFIQNAEEAKAASEEAAEAPAEEKTEEAAE